VDGQYTTRSLIAGTEVVISSDHLAQNSLLLSRPVILLEESCLLRRTLSEFSLYDKEMSMNAVRAPMVSGDEEILFWLKRKDVRPDECRNVTKVCRSTGLYSASILLPKSSAQSDA
jgi:hypothetical protein